MLMHSVMLGERQIVQVPLVWTYWIEKGPVNDGFNLLDKRKGQTFS